MIAKILGTLLLSALALPALAEDIYRWTDETGRVNYGNVVPDRFKRVATKIDTSSTRVVVTNPQNAPSASTGSSSAGTTGRPEVTGPHGVGY
jgi:hypothetical protein